MIKILVKSIIFLFPIFTNLNRDVKKKTVEKEAVPISKDEKQELSNIEKKELNINIKKEAPPYSLSSIENGYQNKKNQPKNIGSTRETLDSTPSKDKLDYYGDKSEHDNIWRNITFKKEIFYSSDSNLSPKNKPENKKTIVESKPKSSKTIEEDRNFR